MYVVNNAHSNEGTHEMNTPRPLKARHPEYTPDVEEFLSMWTQEIKSDQLPRFVLNRLTWGCVLAPPMYESTVDRAGFVGTATRVQFARNKRGDIDSSSVRVVQVFARKTDDGIFNEVSLTMNGDVKARDGEGHTRPEAYDVTGMSTGYVITGQDQPCKMTQYQKGGFTEFEMEQHFSKVWKCITMDLFEL